MSIELWIVWFIINVSIHVIVIFLLLMERCLWIVDLLTLTALGIVCSNLFLIELNMAVSMIFMGVLQNPMRLLYRRFHHFLFSRTLIDFYLIVYFKSLICN